MTSTRTALPIIQKTYDFIIWLMPKIGRFPRSQKFLLGDRIQNGLLDFLGLLVEAEFSSRKPGQLRKANVEFERVRLLLRMSNDLHLLGEDGYRFASTHKPESTVLRKRGVSMMSPDPVPVGHDKVRANSWCRKLVSSCRVKISFRTLSSHPAAFAFQVTLLAMILILSTGNAIAGVYSATTDPFVLQTDSFINSHSAQAPAFLLNTYDLATSSVDHSVSVGFTLDTQGEDASGSGMLSGLITDMETAQPISGVQLTLEPINLTAASFGDGSYSFNSIQTGNGYRLEASKPGYVPRTLYYVNIQNEETTTLDFQLQGYSNELQLVSLIPDPNPGISTIETGGTLSRYYRVVDAVTQLGVPWVPVDYSGDGISGQSLSDEDGIVRISIPSYQIGMEAGATATVNITHLAGAELPPEQQLSFDCEVVYREFFKEWESSSFFGVGISFVQVEAGSGSNLQLQEDIDNGVSGDRLLATRQGYAGAGVSWGVCAPIQVNINGVGAWANAGAEEMFSVTSEDVYEFPYPEVSGWEATGEYILFADGNTGFLDGPLVRLLAHLEDWFTDGHSLESAYRSDARGIDVALSTSASAGVGVGNPVDMTIGVDASVSGDGHMTLCYRNDAVTNQHSVEAALSATIAGGVGGGMSFGAYSSPALSEFEEYLQFRLSGEKMWGTGTSMLFDSGTGLLQRMDLSQVNRTINHSTYNGSEVTTVYSISGQDLLNSIAEQVPVIAEQMQFHATGGELSTGRETQDQTFRQCIEQSYAAQMSDAPSANVIVETECREITPAPGFELLISGSLSGERTISAQLAASASFYEADGRVTRRGEYYRGRHLFTEEYFDSPSLDVEYGDLLNSVIDQTPLSVRIAAFIWDLIIFWDLRNEQSFPLGDGGSYVTLAETALPAGVDSLQCNSWGWYGASSTVMASSLPAEKSALFQRIRERAERSYGMRYGIGGFYQFEPFALVFEDTVMMTIVYQDEEIDGFDESELAMYVEDKENHDWIFVGGVLEADSNRVTAQIDSLGTYTLAPLLPRGRFSLIPSTPTIPADDSSRVTFTSSQIINNNGSIVSDGSLFDLEADAGTLIATDADPEREGLQVAAAAGQIVFELQAGVISYSTEVRAASVTGTAIADTTVLFTDDIPSAAPTALTVLPGNGVLELSWTAPDDPDIAGYRLYYDTDGPEPPFDGQAGVGGFDSPITLGDLTSYTLGWLANDSIYYLAVAAYDISENESPLSEVVSAVPSLAAVYNLQIRIEGDDVLLNWTPVPGANEYDIYRLETPYGQLSSAVLLGTTYLPFFQHTNGVQEQQGFYRVVAR